MKTEPEQALEEVRNITVEWTGKYPTLCFGEWIIEIDGTRIVDDTEDTILKKNMYTFGEYSEWYFDDDYSEVWDYCIDGLKYDKWVQSEPGKPLVELIKRNGFDLTEDEIEELYFKLQREDFRNNSCGGCI